MILAHGTWGSTSNAPPAWPADQGKDMALMKLSPDALGLLSKGLKPETRARWPLVGWLIDILVVAGHGVLLYWFYVAISG